MVVVSTMMLTGSLQYAMRQTAEAENLFTSVERILEYGRLAPETTTIAAGEKSSWIIASGKLEYRNVSLKYGDGGDEDNVLEGVSFTVEAGQKVGIVGRTGAGKSSLVAALFRLTEYHHGDILIDGVSLKTKDLAQVRRNISIIPQDPILFAGTMRSNLDPFENHADTELWRALDQAHLADALSISKNGTTNTAILIIGYFA